MSVKSSRKQAAEFTEEDVLWEEDQDGNVVDQSAGFYAPRYTQIPDELLDKVMARLNNAELRVLLYIARRTLGFKKDKDAIGIKQFAEGITRRDGTRLNEGIGLKERQAQRALRSLLEKGLIEGEERTDEQGKPLATVYRLKLRD